MDAGYVTTLYLLDLTAAQVARIEDAIGVPMDAWRSAPKGRLYPLLIHELAGTSLEELNAMTMRELVGMVELEDADPKAESEPS